MTPRTAFESRFPAIGDYGVVGDGRTAALVSSAGAVEWLCLPDLDRPSLFAAMLDRDRGGAFCISCRDGGPAGRRYRTDSMVLETDLASGEGAIRVIDCLVVNGRSAGLATQRELLRVVVGLSGAPTVDVRFAPAPNYGARRAALRDRGAMGWAFAQNGGLTLLRSEIPLARQPDGALAAGVRVAAGEKLCLSLSFSQVAPAPIPSLGPAALDRLESTDAWWKAWASSCTYRGPHRDAVMRSLLTLKALQFCQSGAMAAAATTSLPEAIPGTRNWDYRFCWLRDSGFVLRALVDTGFWQEGRAFFDWLMHSTRITQPRLQPLYTLFGRNDIGERTLPSLGGFRGCAPVRDGNGAARQFQLDVYGTVIGAARDFIDRGHRVGAEERRLLLRFGEIICASWREPDDGIWEFRHAARHYTYSKVMAWAGLNDLIWLADHYGFVIPRQRFERDRAALRARIMTEGLDDGGKRFKGALDLDYADASLLLLPRAGFIAPDHPLMIATWDHLRAELERDGMFQRYPLGLDRLEGSEGCFVVCSFWAAGYLAQAGRLDEAARYFEAALGRANDLGLMSEEVDPASNALLGNIPQAFSHAGLINAALALEGRPVNPEREKAAA